MVDGFASVPDYGRFAFAFWFRLMAGNHNSGRRPKPTALHVLNGNPSRKKLNENEVRPPAGDPQKPAGMSQAGSVMWDELAPVCVAMGTLTTADVVPFATMCELQATMRAVSASKDGRELFHLQADEDDPARLAIVVDSALKLERETATALRPYYALFGLEPISRAKINVPKEKPPASKWAGIVG
jgi:phage terminase small subunit